MSVVVAAKAWPYRVKLPVDPSIVPPQALPPYGIDWNDWLPEGTDPSLLSAIWLVENATLVHHVMVAGVAYVWFSEAIAPTVSLTCRVTLDVAPVTIGDDRTLLIPVKER
jgi:hypothetical protein